ncbi:MAG: sulfotransferase [Parvibaculaceae bacterium]|jgi:hypothetical protein
MIGEFAFQLIGARWSGIRLLAGAIAANPRCTVSADGKLANFLTGKAAAPAENEPDAEKRTKHRIDDFQKACWQKAGEAPGLKWGHQTMTEDIGRLLDAAGATSSAIDGGNLPGRGSFNAVDYFVCRCLRVPAIVIVRDGRAVIPALMKHDQLTTAAAVARWKFSIHLLKRVVYFTKRCSVVRFEDLARDPKSTMEEVSAFLGLSYDDAMIKSLLPEAKNKALKDIDPHVLSQRTANEPWVAEIVRELEVCGYLE